MTPTPYRKIVSPDELLERLGPQRAGRQVVQCHGCFDIVHPGHIRYLQFARRLGDILVVSLTGDANIAKGPDRPYIPEELRAENLAALELVDWVVVDPHPTAVELLARVKPDIYVKGGEYAASSDPRFLRERQVVESYGGRVVFHSGEIVYSSTRLIPALAQEPQLDRCRLQTLCLRHGIDEAAIAECLRRIEDLPVVIVGDVFRDQYVFCDVQDIAAETPTPLLRRLGERSFWAGAAAVALQARALGARATLVTGVGPDGASRALLEELRDRGVSVEATSRALPLHQQRSFMADDTRMFQVREGDSAPLDTACEQELLERVRARLPAAGIVVWCDLGLGVATPRLIGQVNAAARQLGLMVVAGVGGAGDLRAAAGADLLYISERRLRSVSGQSTASLPAIVWDLLERTGGRRAFVSLHKRGLLAFDGADAPAAGEAGRLRSEFVPSLATHFADLSGVEEVVLASAALALAGGAGSPLAAYLSAAAEALAAEQSGRATIGLDGLHHWFQRRGELSGRTRFVADAGGGGRAAAAAVAGAAK